MGLAVLLESCFEHGFLRMMRDKPCDVFEFEVFTVGCEPTEMGEQRRPLNFPRGSAWQRTRVHGLISAARWKEGRSRWE